MNKYHITTEINTLICEANNCKKNASEEIKIDVGKFGIISLLLCKDCLPRFVRKDGVL